MARSASAQLSLKFFMTGRTGLDLRIWISSTPTPVGGVVFWLRSELGVSNYKLGTSDFHVQESLILT